MMEEKKIWQQKVVTGGYGCNMILTVVLELLFE